MPQECQKILPDRMADRTPEGIEHTMADSGPEDMPDRTPKGLPDRMPEECCNILRDRKANRTVKGMWNTMADSGPEDMPDSQKNVRMCCRIFLLPSPRRPQYFCYTTPGSCGRGAHFFMCLHNGISFCRRSGHDPHRARPGAPCWCWTATDFTVLRRPRFLSDHGPRWPGACKSCANCPERLAGFGRFFCCRKFCNQCETVEKCYNINQHKQTRLQEYMRIFAMRFHSLSMDVRKRCSGLQKWRKVLMATWSDSQHRSKKAPICSWHNCSST